eukprot:CAMPEP_0113691612 /NCGR_PEP_ID=MMETSP0038_2-20120614/18563_1 /TAXON_ID=2898 /ORGANISM="Cryptomonas paramecium" /LENGTH=159 /DNA_ID=CAMNT_0000613307 /DNA_START=47 /DNA_END=526 /DNA_ORIENTATION=+ /assembly_acc=CAM_ASM_000170
MYAPVSSQESGVENSRPFSRWSIVGVAVATFLLCAAIATVVNHDVKYEDSVQNVMYGRQAAVGAAREQSLYDEAMEDEAQKQAAIAYATFVKSDDGNPAHGNLSGVYDEYAQKITHMQNSTLEYQDEMKTVEGEIKFENDEHKNQYEGLPDEVWDGQIQ